MATYLIRLLFCAQLFSNGFETGLLSVSAVPALKGTTATPRLTNWIISMSSKIQRYLRNFCNASYPWHHQCPSASVGNNNIRHNGLGFARSHNHRREYIPLSYRLGSDVISKSAHGLRLDMFLINPFFLLYLLFSLSLGLLPHQAKSSYSLFFG
jgi:hypothetical protein